MCVLCGGECRRRYAIFKHSDTCLFPAVVTPRERERERALAFDSGVNGSITNNNYVAAEY